MVQERLYPVYQHMQCHLVFPAFRDDDVRIPFARFDKLLMHRFYRTRVLLKHRIHAASPLFHIAQQAADQTDICIRIDKHLDIHQIAQLFIRKDQDPF